MAENNAAGDALPIEQALQQYRRALAHTRWPFGPAARHKRNDQVSKVLKTLALQVSRAAVQRVADRRARADSKETLYNHVLPLLESLHAAESRLHTRQIRIFVGVGGTFAIAMIAAAVVLV